MSKESVTVAGIDCGTNSIRLKIACVDADGMHEVVPRILRVIRLGQDVDKTHRFADEALERAYVAAREFAGVIAEHPKTVRSSRMRSNVSSACAPKSFPAPKKPT